jgi:hypothetical protein
MPSLALNDTFVDDGAAIEDGVLVDDDASVNLDADAAAKDGAASIKAKKKNAKKKKPDDVSDDTMNMMKDFGSMNLDGKRRSSRLHVKRN